MERVAFTMKILAGFMDEYKRRHEEIWPELTKLLKETGISEYSIFIDEENNLLFGMLNSDDQEAFDSLPRQETMQLWWKYMSDIVETNADNSPVIIPLKEMFYLP